ncbi:6-phosphogluconolactonase [Paratissierella segnis]|jgi:glucosamine-6-phosphate deaminase|uniref:6-phosphogluconolactonase n=1 Tax=Paratissierella segnis TaxID=2763679 RepID=A0A926IEI0_9FIRM|nr:6-phosphogluconolactonase [Paratissierella segnis]MBC8587397.1 6-phosphogluconolactonase [Paratissierella segnis]
MEIHIEKNADELGKHAASLIADLLNITIKERGEARILLSTGASQFSTINALINKDIDWEKVEMFHLDEYIGLDENHPASFRRYLMARFVSKVNLKNAYLVDGNGNIEENIKKLTENLNLKPIDIGVIGIGENGHIAFNDPPADFDTNESYKIVELDNKCKMQQVGEGWFEDINNNVPATILKSHPKWTLFLDEESASLVKDII